MPTPIECSRSFHVAPRRPACAPAPACTLLTTISPTSSTTRSIARGLPVDEDLGRLLDRRAGCSLARAKSLPVPSGQDPEHGVLQVVAPVERGDHGVQAAVAARDDDPAGAGPVQRAVRARPGWTSPAPRPTVCDRRTVSAVCSDSSSAVPASLLVITRSGSIGGDPILCPSRRVARPHLEEPSANASHRHHRRPVGRRGQGQGDRRPRQPRRLRREVQRRQQRRPHRGHRPGETQQKYALHLLPSGILTPGCTPGDRQRRRRRPRRAVRGDRRARGARRRHRRCSRSAPTRTSSPTTTAPSTRSPSGSSAPAGSAPPAAASARRTPTR